jgi:hypothetical protein
MDKPTGGRGKKAPYNTAQVRVPVPIKPSVEALIAAYRDSLDEAALTDSQSSSDSGFAALLALKLVDKFISEENLSEKMHTRNNTNLRRFRDWLKNF